MGPCEHKPCDHKSCEHKPYEQKLCGKIKENRLEASLFFYALVKIFPARDLML